MNGLFISLEGGEGSGKSTLIKLIQKYYETKKRVVITTREPGGTSISEEIRDVLLNKNNTMMNYKTEALLYAASRSQHLNELILPAIQRGNIVLCDRFLDSSLAYQGYARNLGVEEILEINKFALDKLPDVTFFIDVPPSIAMTRVERRVNKQDRLDLEKLDFHNIVYKGFKAVAKKYSDRIVTIDGTKTIDEIYNDIISHLEKNFS